MFYNYLYNVFKKIITSLIYTYKTDLWVQYYNKLIIDTTDIY